jgi:hypothetical protein
MSGPFRVQIGVDDNGAPVFADCGQMNLYRTSTGGREWRLENTCDQMLELMAPLATPTPVITPSPTPGGGGPTPGGTPSGSAQCPAGFIPKTASNLWTLPGVVLQVGQVTTFCVDIPATSAMGLLEAKTVNKANLTCSNVEMTATSPSGAQYFSTGSEPDVVSFVSPGRWTVALLLTEGCQRYDLSVSIN